MLHHLYDRARLFVEIHKPSLVLLLITVIGITLFAATIIVDDRIVGSDDTVFQQQTAPYTNAIDWIGYRYESWSGRIFSEGFVYIFSNNDILLWKTFTILAYALLVGLLFAYYRLFNRKPDSGKDRLMLTAIICSIFLMDKSVLAEGLYWVTGSMVYFWTSVLGLLALYPLVYFVVKRVRPVLPISIAGLMAAVIAASSQEQVGLLLAYISIVLLTYCLFSTGRLSRKNVPWYLLLFTFVIVASLVASLLAPGNTVRSGAEVDRWLPDLHATPVLDRLHYGYRWLLEAFIKHSGFLLIGSWILTVLLLTRKKSQDALDKVVALGLSIAAAFSLSGSFAATSYWLDFYATWKPENLSLLGSLNLLPWGVVLLVTCMSPLVVFRKQSIGYILSLLYLGAGAATAALLATPTMYASLWRSFFVPSILLIVIFLVLLNAFISLKQKNRFILIGVMVSLALSHFIFQFTRLVST